jgi:hypothetical protein
MYYFSKVYALCLVCYTLKTYEDMERSVFCFEVDKGTVLLDSNCIIEAYILLCFAIKLCNLIFVNLFNRLK